MLKRLSPLFLAIALTPALAIAGERQLDPIFEAVPAKGPTPASCLQSQKKGHPLMRGMSSSAGQAIIGGLIGAAVGNQIGDGSGRDIATGVGAAAGAAIGAERARRQELDRIRACRQYRSYAGDYRG